MLLRDRHTDTHKQSDRNKPLAGFNDQKGISFNLYTWYTYSRVHYANRLTWVLFKYPMHKSCTAHFAHWTLHSE